MADRKKIVQGAAIAAAGAAAAAAGYFFYGSRNAKKNRLAAAKWARDLKDGAVERVRSVQSFDKETVLDAIDTAAAAYRSVRGARRKDVENAIGELRTHWRDIVREVRDSVTGQTTEYPRKSVRAKRIAPPRARKTRARKQNKR